MWPALGKGTIQRKYRFFDMRACSKKNSANIVYDTGENYNLASTFSRGNEVDLSLVAPAAYPRSCGCCLRLYCIIKFPHIEITRTEGCARYCVRCSNDSSYEGAVFCSVHCAFEKYAWRNFCAELYPFPRAVYPLPAEIRNGITPFVRMRKMFLLLNVWHIVRLS